MEWTALRDFVSVAKTGSLSGAARELGLSQPTLGRRIEQLEQQLNAILFNRTTQGLSLTETGEQILEYAERMSDEALSIERIASGVNQRMQGSVRVTMTDLLGSSWLPSKLPEFYERFPGLQLEVFVDNRSLDLIRREADIALRFSRPQQPDLVARKVIEFHYGLYASKDYLSKYGRPKSLRDLKQHKLVSYDETIFNYPPLKRLETLFGADNIVYRSTNIAGILAAAREGIGISGTACYFSDKEAVLERILRKHMDVSFEGWLVTHKDIYQSVRIKRVFDFLAEKLNEDAALFAGRND